MDLFNSVEVCIPVMQIALLLFICTLALLFGRKKLALLTCYVFTLYWGSLVNMEKLVVIVGGKAYYGNSMLYFTFGFLVVFLAAVGFILHPD